MATFTASLPPESLQSVVLLLLENCCNRGRGHWLVVPSFGEGERSSEFKSRSEKKTSFRSSVRQRTSCLAVTLSSRLHKVFKLRASSMVE